MSDLPVLARDLAAFEGVEFDLVVIGGGITGAGIARHAAAIGLRVALFEAEDFASGTSSRSTKLIHGGLRYLAMGDFALVREGALERKSVHAMAPHLAEPVTMVVPVAGWLERLKFKVGLSLYEALGNVAATDRHRTWNATELAAAEPSMIADKFPFAFAYREYLTDDARLVLATLRAAVAKGAIVANHARVSALHVQDEGYLIFVDDGLAGDALEVRARCVVNAAGPWAEQLLSGSRPADAPRLHLSKGVHIGVSRERLPLNNMVFMETDDKRTIFAIPRGQVTYIGTTDTSHEGDPEWWPTVEVADIEYLLKPLHNYFGGEPLVLADVVSSWAGLRPLIHEPGKAAKEMSRKDEVWRSENGMITIAGGKLTGFRKMAEDVMHKVGETLKCDVRLEAPLAPLPGGDFGATAFDMNAQIERIATRYQLDPAAAHRLVRLYGTEVEQMLGTAPTPVTPTVFMEEIDWAVATDGARELEDLIYRRLRTAWYEPGELVELLPAATERMAELLGWDVSRQQQQRIKTEERLAADLSAVPPN
jgi:glycerol-3-phosphate dehydrogenase